jgi:hypothetical protein
MSVLALLNMYVSVNGSSLHDHGRQAMLALDRTVLDASAFGDGWTVNTGGLRSGTLTIVELDDFADNSIDEMLWDAFSDADGVVTFEVRPVNGAVSSNNPAYTGSLLVQQFTVGGDLNTMAQKSLTFPLSGAVTRATST